MKQDMNIVIADIECDNLLDDLNELHCISIGDQFGMTVDLYHDHPKHPRTGNLKTGLKVLSDADYVVFHNGNGYDYWALEYLYPGTVDYDKCIDTLLLSRLKDPSSRHSLAEIGMRMGFPKDTFDDFSKYSHELGARCMVDVEITQKVWAQVKDYWVKFPEVYALEHKVSHILARQERHGFRFDKWAAQEVEGTLRDEFVGLEEDLQSIFPPITYERYSEKTGKRLKDKIEIFNPGSRVQIAQRLMDKYGWEPVETTSTGKPKIDESILSKLDYPEAQTMARYFRLQKMLGQLADGSNSWLKLERNGRIHGQVNQVGARTNRMSHYNPNVAQVDKDKRMRSLFLPDLGDVLVGCDAEGLELRCLGHYLAKFDGGQFSKAVVEGRKEDGTDAHSINQQACGLRSRDSGKTIIYASIYGGGNAKLGVIEVEDRQKAGVAVPASDLTEKALKKSGKRIRAALMDAMTGYEELQDRAKSAHNKRGYLYGLDGRPILSASEHSALNTLLQSAGAIIMKKALVLFDDAVRAEGIEVKYCANVHDEVQMSVAPEIADKVGQTFANCITAAGEELGMLCPLSGDYAVGQNWSETH